MKLVILFMISTVSCLNQTFSPTVGVLRLDGAPEKINLSLWFAENESNDCGSYNLKMSAKSGHAKIIDALKRNFVMVNNTCTVQFTLKGSHIGRTVIQASITDNLNTNSSISYPVVIIRSKTDFRLTEIFTIFITIVIVTTSLAMGTQLEVQVLIDILKHPWPIITGLCCQLLLMPLIAFAWGKVLLSDITFFWYSYFAIGCAPGGGMSNMWTILMDGNLNLSAAMTFFSNILALANIPLWMYTLGKYVILKNETIGVPFVNIVSGLALMIVPSIIGLLIRWKLPKVADFITKIIKIAMFIFILAIVTFGMYTNRFVFGLITWRTVLAGTLLPWTGFTMGLIISFLIQRNWRDARTIGIETGIQNMNLAIIMLQFSFKPPESDLGMVIPFCCIIFTPLPLFVIFVGYIIHKKFVKKNEVAPEITEMKTDEVENKQPN